MVSNEAARTLMIAALVGALVASAAWYQERGGLHHLRMGELKPIATLLKEDRELLQALQTDSGESGILTTYLAKIRADGVAKHAEMKQRLDRFAENNSAILALINVYSPHAKTASFNSEADKFRRYAIAWRDRWDSVMELFMAGGNYPVAGISFPITFPLAVEAEIAATR